ncbi:MAG TPA: hypothetical protein VFM24_05060 [Nitrospira sp.]|nr:hypothetical protein [Nitrospira sp.]
MIMYVLLGVALVVGLPLVGILLSGRPIQPYLEFPPQTRVVQAAPFSWPVFVILALLIVLTVGPILLRIARSQDSVFTQPHVLRPFPWWGWLGAALTMTSWVLAWNRFPSFAALQPHTFAPLWLGYIISINGWTFHRTGHCLMLDRPGFFLAMFPASAVFWWIFEYLNRFVQNWYYVGPHSLTPEQYFLQATLPFSTVLPAVLSTMDFLSSVKGLTAGMDRLPPLRLDGRRWVAGVLLIAATGGLVGLGIWPQLLFPLVWVGPLLLITALQIFRGQETIFSRLMEGDATSLWLAAVAALVCGFWWELWNWKSLAHWEYAIPAVHGFQLFEMPLLGYAGYLPFGLECLAVIQWLFPSHYGEIIRSRWDRRS